MQDRLGPAWTWLGSRSAFSVFVVFYAAGALVQLVPETTEPFVALGLFGLFGLHLWARPERRWEVFGVVWWPGPVYGIVAVFTEPPLWFALTLLALAVLFAWSFDREESAQASAPDRPELARQ